MKAESNVILAASVDMLAGINAQIKALEDKAKVLKEVLIASNLPSVEGEAYKAAIKFVEPSPSIDYKAIVLDAMDKGLLADKVVNSKKYQKVKAPYYSVSLYDL